MAKTPEQIRAEIAAARESMADGVRGLASQVHPSVIKQQTVRHVKQTVTDKVNSVKAVLVDDAGVRWDRVGTIVLVTVAVVVVHGALWGAVRRLRH